MTSLIAHRSCPQWPVAVDQAELVCDPCVSVGCWQGVVAVEIDGAVELDDDIAIVNRLEIDADEITTGSPLGVSGGPRSQRSSERVPDCQRPGGRAADRSPLALPRVPLLRDGATVVTMVTLVVRSGSLVFGRV